jgi:hypothetical protein
MKAYVGLGFVGLLILMFGLVNMAFAADTGDGCTGQYNATTGQLICIPTGCTPEIACMERSQEWPGVGSVNTCTCGPWGGETRCDIGWYEQDSQVVLVCRDNCENSGYICEMDFNVIYGEVWFFCECVVRPS